MTDGIESFRLAPSDRERPVPSVAWALLGTLLCFFVVKFWQPYADVTTAHALWGVAMAALIAWWGFIRIERPEGQGLRRLAEAAATRAIVWSSVILTTTFVLKLAYDVASPMPMTGA